MGALRRLGAPLLGLAAAAVLALAGRGLDDVAREGQLGPGFWPRLVLVGLAVSCAVRLVELVRRPESRAAERPAIARPTLIAAVALIVAYVATAPVLGFPLVTAAFIAGFMLLAGARSPAGILAAAGLGTAGLLYLFVKIVYLPLPKGAGVFEGATLAVYRALRIF